MSVSLIKLKDILYVTTCLISKRAIYQINDIRNKISGWNARIRENEFEYYSGF